MNVKKGLNIHIGKGHKTELLHAPEKQRSISKEETFRQYWTKFESVRKKHKLREVEETLHVLKDLNKEIRRNPGISYLHLLLSNWVFLQFPVAYLQ